MDTRTVDRLNLPRKDTDTKKKFEGCTNLSQTLKQKTSFGFEKMLSDYVLF